MKNLTPTQQTIICNITAQFNLLNSRSKFNYIDISDILELKKRVANETALAQNKFNTAIAVHNEALSYKFQTLIEDLQNVGELKFKVTTEHQKMNLSISVDGVFNSIGINCTAWGRSTKLSNGNMVADEISPEYYLKNNASHYNYNSFEDLVSSPQFKSKLSTLINSF